MASEADVAKAARVLERAKAHQSVRPRSSSPRPPCPCPRTRRPRLLTPARVPLQPAAVEKVLLNIEAKVLPNTPFPTRYDVPGLPEQICRLGSKGVAEKLQRALNWLHGLDEHSNQMHLEPLTNEEMLVRWQYFLYQVSEHEKGPVWSKEDLGAAIGYCQKHENEKRVRRFLPSLVLAPARARADPLSSFPPQFDRVPVVPGSAAAATGNQEAQIQALVDASAHQQAELQATANQVEALGKQLAEQSLSHEAVKAQTEHQKAPSRATPSGPSSSSSSLSRAAGRAPALAAATALDASGVAVSAVSSVQQTSPSERTPFSAASVTGSSSSAQHPLVDSRLAPSSFASRAPESRSTSSRASSRFPPSGSTMGRPSSLAPTSSSPSPSPLAPAKPARDDPGVSSLLLLSKVKLEASEDNVIMAKIKEEGDDVKLKTEKGGIQDEKASEVQVKLEEGVDENRPPTSGHRRRNRVRTAYEGTPGLPMPPRQPAEPWPGLQMPPAPASSRQEARTPRPAPIPSSKKRGLLRGRAVEVARAAAAAAALGDEGDDSPP